MIVTEKNKKEVFEALSQEKFLSLDTETTGLKWYHEDVFFSIIIAGELGVFYFDFNGFQNNLLTFNKCRLKFERLFAAKNKTWFMHNAKFDMNMLATQRLEVKGTIHCTEAMARLCHSYYRSYSLAECLKRAKLGIEKTDIVKKYILKNKLFKDIHIEGKKKPIREMYYHRVPLNIIVPYAETDALGTYDLGKYQMYHLEYLATKSPRLPALVKTEQQITKVCQKMEAKGIRLDEKYNAWCLTDEINTCLRIEKEWLKKTGKVFSDSNVQFAAIFKKLGVKFPRTALGNPSFAKDALATLKHPLAVMISEWRAAKKRAGTYHSSFHYFGVTGRIHAGVRQTGTAPGRMSYASPNLQNVPKSDDEEKSDEAARVRRCFVPPKNYCFFMPDYDQMEYRLMLEFAGEQKLIDKINTEGLDVHTATAEMVGVSRKAAKTINFMLLYGGGAQKLADALGVSFEQGKLTKERYFMKLPAIKRWINKVIWAAEQQSYIINHAGRLVTIFKQDSYKAPNYIIQGSCADIMKQAMVKIDTFLENKKSYQVIQIHDELVIALHKTELNLASEIIEIMNSTFKYKKIQLTVGPKYSWESWADYREGYPHAETRVKDLSKSRAVF